jgi:hypothetical protein
MGYFIRFHEEAVGRYITAQILTAQSYTSLPYVDAMVRRRLYWLCVGIDKSSAAVANKVVMITREHCATVQLPTAMYVASLKVQVSKRY